MNFRSLIAGILLATAALSVADDWSGVGGMVVKKPALVSILEAGGGPHHFRSMQALKRAVGDNRADEEVKKLETTFGEGKVYRFFAVSDFIFPEAWRIANVQWGTPYNPLGAGGLPDFSNSKEAMDRILGGWLHDAVMRRADERFGPGAMDTWHAIADALGAAIK
jgi:hypothetical protein